jgi:hypothetical protein
VIIVVLVILILFVGFVFIPLKAAKGFPAQQRSTIDKTTQEHDKSNFDQTKTATTNEIANPRHEQDFALQTLESREVLVIKTHQETKKKVKKKTCTTELMRMTA